MADEHQLSLRQADQPAGGDVTLRNAKSDIEATFEDANVAAGGFLSALSRTDDALYRALETIYGFVKAGERCPEEFEIFKRAKGIKRRQNAKINFQHYVKFFIKANTDRREIVGRASKYGAVLDHAWEQGISGEELVKWIKDRGIENICKERRRRKFYRATSASAGIPVLPFGDPSSESKLNSQAQERGDPKEQKNFCGTLDRPAGLGGLDSTSVVKVAEQNIFTQTLEQWGDDDRGREIGRLRVILYRHGISW
jgi:hypothetical protein